MILGLWLWNFGKSLFSFEHLHTQNGQSCFWFACLLENEHICGVQEALYLWWLKPVDFRLSFRACSLSVSQSLGFPGLVQPNISYIPWLWGTTQNDLQLTLVIFILWISLVLNPALWFRGSLQSHTFPTWSFSGPHYFGAAVFSYLRWRSRDLCTPFFRLVFSLLLF